MKWWNKFFHFIKQQEILRIKIIPIGNLLIFEVYQPYLLKNRFFEVYYQILESRMSKCKVVTVCQYYDENQGQLLSKECEEEELSRKYNLRFTKTKAFNAFGEPMINDSNYIIHFFGAPNLKWMRCVLRFGGTCLSNIIYGDSENCDQWFEKTINRNGLFVKWYWSKTEPTIMEELLCETKMICWTSDSQLTFIVKMIEKDNVLQELSDLAKKLSLPLEFV